MYKVSQTSIDSHEAVLGLQARHHEMAGRFEHPRSFQESPARRALRHEATPALRWELGSKREQRGELQQSCGTG